MLIGGTNVHGSLVLWLERCRPIFKHFRYYVFKSNFAYMKNWSLPLGCWSSAFSSHIILTTLLSSGFCEWQKLPLRDGLSTARHTGEKEFTINLRAVGLPPLSIYTHYTLFNSPSWAFQQGRVPRTVRCKQSCHRSPWWWLSPTGVRRAALGAVMSAAGAAEAGIVLVTTELGLQDQVTVGKVGLVHTLSAQVHSVTHSSCSQAKGEPAVNLSSDCYSLPKDIACSCFLHPTTSKFSPTSGRRWWVSRWNRHLCWDTRKCSLQGEERLLYLLSM